MKDFIANIVAIKKAIENKKLVVFAGAGVSIDSGVPGWNDLIKAFKKDIEIPEEENDPLRIAQMYFNKKHQKEFVEKVKSVLQYKQTHYNENHEAIFELSPEHILTTNFDDLLEQVMGVRAEPFSIVRQDSDFPYALNTNLLVKVHGDLETTSLVLKEDDYLAYASSHPLLESFIRSIFASKIVLFVGYSFSDIDLKMIMHSVRHILANDFQRAYLLSIDQPFHPSQREYLDAKGIVSLNYHDAALPDGSNFMVTYLKGSNCEGKNYYKQGVSLSAKGQQLLNFLTFIRRYNHFHEDLRSAHPVDQMYFSLQRFQDVRNLPPQFFEDLYPFSLHGKAEYRLWTLRTPNKELIDVWKDWKEVAGQMQYAPADDHYTESQKQDFTDKLHHIARVLNYSYVGWIGTSFNAGNEDKFVRVKSDIPDRCDCFNCLLNRFDLKRVSYLLQTIRIHPASDIKQDLLLAFINYRLGNFQTSFHLFEEAATKAWQMKKYISYYIAKQNSKYLKLFIQSYETTNPDEEERGEDKKQQLFHKIDDLDLDYLIHRIAKPGTHEIKLLRLIKYDEIIERAMKKIDQGKAEITENYHRYKEGGRMSGAVLHEPIILELAKLYSFYSNNYLIADEFTSLKKTCQKAFEALVISYATSDDYDGKLKVFDRLFFDAFVLYGDAGGLKKVTELFGVNQLKFSHDDLAHIVETAIGFMTSVFTKTILGAVEDTAVRKMLANHFFRQKMGVWFNNICLILSGIELTDQQGEKLVEAVKDFIKTESFLYWYNYQYLASALMQHHRHFKLEDVEEMLTVFAQNKSFLIERNEMMTAFDYIIEQKGEDQKINNEKLILSIAQKVKKSESMYLVYLWKMSGEPIKALIAPKIGEILNEKDDFNLFRSVVRNAIADPQPYLVRYLKHFSGGPDVFYKREQKVFMKDFEFINLAYVLYEKGLVPMPIEQIDAIPGLPPYIRFYLNPFVFDYSQFNIEWIQAFDWDVFFHVFKKVPAIREAIIQALKEEPNDILASVFAKHFMTATEPVLQMS